LTSIKSSGVHAWVARKTLTSHGVSRRIFNLARRALLQLGDPAVQYGDDNVAMLLPASHPLPFYQKVFPHYDKALPRLARRLHALRGPGEFVIIDIGANVGDTAVPLLADPDTFVIAIDGNPAYTGFLRANLQPFAMRSFIAEHFIGPPTMTRFGVETNRGTAKLVETKGENAVGLKPLSDILAMAGKSSIDLIKIDTDGFDVEIIRHSADVLSKTQSTLFFEFDPKLFAPVSPDGWNVFAHLVQFGYRYALAYGNTGQFLRSFALNDEEAVADIRAFIMSGTSTTYLDIAAFKEKDIYDQCRASELAHFAGKG
jgi:FkbM family methyltransferase